MTPFRVRIFRTTFVRVVASIVHPLPEPHLLPLPESLKATLPRHCLTTQAAQPLSRQPRSEQQRPTYIQFAATYNLYPWSRLDVRARRLALCGLPGGYTSDVTATRARTSSAVYKRAHLNSAVLPREACRPHTE